MITTMENAVAKAAPLITLTFFLFAAWAFALEYTAHAPVGATGSPVAPCWEDEPCWDPCSMGNGYGGIDSDCPAPWLED